ncbi:MAG: hypothetical protein AAGL89_14565 [Pseudomonadota bacterium]
MKRLVFLTGHFPNQKRRTSMLWVTDHLQEIGWHVTYVTVGYSWLSKLMGDRRLKALDHPPKTGRTEYSATLTGLFHYSPYHPINWPNTAFNNTLSALNWTFPAFWRGKLRSTLARADLVITESGPPVALAGMVRQLSPQATHIYRVSDDIHLLNAPPALLQAERQYQHFDRISTGSPLIAERFKDHPNVTLDPMGVPHAQLDVPTPDPYTRDGRPIAVCAGSTLLDMGQIADTAKAAPLWQIHVIGRLKTTPPSLPNVHWHGELPFAKTLAHIRHADIGLAPFEDVPGVEYQITNSNRILLYRHLGLPILVPGRLADHAIPSLIANTAPDWQARCEAFGKQPEPIPDWTALAAALVQNGVTDPPDVTSSVPDTIVRSRVKTVPPLTSNA